MSTRRDFIKKVGYAAPTIVTLSALPSFAGAGSERSSGIAVQFRSTRRNKQKKAKKDKSLW